MKKIIIIEDDRDILELIKTVLKDNFEIESFNNIEEVFNNKDSIEKCDLIITDFLLVNRTCREIIEQYPHKKYLIVSAYSDKMSSLYDLTTRTLIKYLKKPFGINTLRETVKNMI